MKSTRVFFSFLLFFLAVVANSRGQNACCPDNKTLNADECDGRESLNCTFGIPYLLNPIAEKDDFYYVDVRTSSLVFNNNGSELPPSHYCLGYVLENESLHAIALVCVENEPTGAVNEIPSKWFAIVEIVFRTLEFISIASLLLTVAIYGGLPELRDLQGHCILHFLINYTITYFIANVSFEKNLPFSFAQTNFFYFFAMSSFCWLNITNFNLWKQIRHWRCNFVNTYFIYIPCGYGIPILLFFILTIRYSATFPRIPDFYSILQERGLKWRYFYLPVLANILCVIVASLDSRRILQKSRTRMKLINQRRNGGHLLSKYRYRFVLTDILNSFQGISMFVVLVLTRKRIFKLLAKRKPCGLDCFPTTWNAIRDEETENDNNLTGFREPSDERFLNDDDADFFSARL